MSAHVGSIQVTGNLVLSLFLHFWLRVAQTGILRGMTQAPPSAPPAVEIDGAAVREARKQAGMTITMLAGRVGLTVGYLSQIERGTKPRMSPPAYLRLVEALQIDDPNQIRAS